MTLYLPCGIPASGKSHLATEWFSPTEIVCPDDIREWLTDDMSDQKCNKRVFRIVNEVIDSRMQRGLDVYLDATNLNQHFWPSYKDRVVILMDTPTQECYNRNMARDRQVPAHAMERMKKQFVSLRPQIEDFAVLSSDFKRV